MMSITKNTIDKSLMRSLAVQDAEYLKQYIYEALFKRNEEINEEVKLPKEMDDLEVKNISELDTIFNDSSCSDYIVFTSKLANFIYDYNHKFLQIDLDAQPKKIPVDLFRSETIPLRDVVFRLDIFSDFEKYDENDCLRCIYKDKTLYFIYSSRYDVLCLKSRCVDDHVEIDPSIMYLKNSSLYVLGYSGYQYSTKLAAYSLAEYFLGIWYEVQHLLLNPYIHEPVFSKSSKVKQNVDGYIVQQRPTDKRKRRTRYVRYKEFNNSIAHSDVLRNRHTLCWYVIGHTRHYKSGKNVWIDGYWKGPLRDTKKNFDEGRERIITPKR